MSHILRSSTEHKTASLATRAIQHIASRAHNIKLWKLTLRGHLNTDVQAGLELGTFRSRERCFNSKGTESSAQNEVERCIITTKAFLVSFF